MKFTTILLNLLSFEDTRKNSLLWNTVLILSALHTKALPFSTHLRKTMVCIALFGKAVSYIYLLTSCQLNIQTQYVIYLFMIILILNILPAIETSLLYFICLFILYYPNIKFYLRLLLFIISQSRLLRGISDRRYIFIRVNRWYCPFMGHKNQHTTGEFFSLIITHILYAHT